jgi:hypothetical protein
MDDGGVPSWVSDLYRSTYRRELLLREALYTEVLTKTVTSDGRRQNHRWLSREPPGEVPEERPASNELAEVYGVASERSSLY